MCFKLELNKSDELKEINETDKSIRDIFERNYELFSHSDYTNKEKREWSTNNINATHSLLADRILMHSSLITAIKA